MPDPFAPFERPDPDDDSLLVLADRLIEAGDPRGESIALSFADPDAWREYVAAHETELLGADLAGLVAEESADVEWRRGLVERVRLYPWPRSHDDFTDRLPRALGGLALRLTRAFELGAIQSSGSLDDAWDHLPSIPSLHTLRAGGTTHPYGDEHQISWLGLGSVGLAASMQPNLRELWARGSWPELEGLQSDTLESIAIVSSTLAPKAVQEITRARLPRLTRLELGVGDGEYGPSAAIGDFDELLGGGRFPGLTHLGICNAPFANELVAVLAECRLLPRLRSIDLALGVLDAGGATELIERRDRFAHLDRIELGDNPISLEERATLRAALPNVTFDRDPSWREGVPKRERYVSISE